MSYDDISYGDLMYARMCHNDFDCDEVLDDDNCPVTPNPEQEDCDNDAFR